MKNCSGCRVIWLTNKIPNEQIVFPGFGPSFRDDRSDGRVGDGVYVYEYTDE